MQYTQKTVVKDGYLVDVSFEQLTSLGMKCTFKKIQKPENTKENGQRICEEVAGKHSVHFITTEQICT